MTTMTDTVQQTQIDLSWVAKAGGPDVQMDTDGRRIQGLPGWYYFALRADDVGGVNLHTEWVEPTTGRVGTLMVDLSPHEGGEVAWEACFLFCEADEHKTAQVPVRGCGVLKNFEAAKSAALDWRPLVQNLGGIELWTDPVAGSGEARGLVSGDLTWHTNTEGRINWCYRSHAVDGLRGILGFDFWRQGAIDWDSDNLEQMLIDLDEARERARAGLRTLLLNF